MMGDSFGHHRRDTNCRVPYPRRASPSTPPLFRSALLLGRRARRLAPARRAAAARTTRRPASRSPATPTAASSCAIPTTGSSSSPRAACRSTATTSSTAATRPPASMPNSSGNDPRPKDTLFVRRARVELQGTFAQPLRLPHRRRVRVDARPRARTATLTDAYIIVDYFTYLKLQVGQFDAPFTLENRTSDKYFDFMERSVAVRAFGVPANKDDGAMLWGWLPKQARLLLARRLQRRRAELQEPGQLARRSSAARSSRRSRWMRRRRVAGCRTLGRRLVLVAAARPTSARAGDAASTGGGAQNDIATHDHAGRLRLLLVELRQRQGRRRATPSARTSRPTATPSSGRSRPTSPSRSSACASSWSTSDRWSSPQYNDTEPAARRRCSRRRPFTGGNLAGTGYYVELYGWILGDVSFLETPGQQPAPTAEEVRTRRRSRSGA